MMYVRMYVYMYVCVFVCVSEILKLFVTFKKGSMCMREYACIYIRMYMWALMTLGYNKTSVFPNATKWEKVQSSFQCIFVCFSGECSYFLQDG